MTTTKTNRYGIDYEMHRQGGRIALLQIFISPRTGFRGRPEHIGTFDDARVARAAAVRDQHVFEVVTGEAPDTCCVDETALGALCEVSL